MINKSTSAHSFLLNSYLELSKHPSLPLILKKTLFRTLHRSRPTYLLFLFICKLLTLNHFQMKQ